MSVITLSDLYDISLDVLLKEDKKMIEHLEESTNVVKSNRRLIKIILIAIYFALWTVGIVLHSISIGMVGDAMEAGWSEGMESIFQTAGNLDNGFIIICMVALPVLAGIISFIIGSEDKPSKYSWLIILFFGAMGALMLLSTIIVGGELEILEPKLNTLGVMAVPGALLSGCGLMLAMSIRHDKEKAEKKKLLKEN